MNQADWKRLTAAADRDSDLARRLALDPIRAAREVGVELSQNDDCVIRAFADRTPSPDELHELAPDDVELVIVPNH